MIEKVINWIKKKRKQLKNDISDYADRQREILDELDKVIDKEIKKGNI